MAHEIHAFKVGTRIASADYSAKQYYLVKLATGKKVILTGNGELAFGVIQNEPKADEAVEVCTLGVTKVVAGDAITEGANVASDVNGKCVPAVTTDAIIGKALEAAGADGDIITIYFYPNGVQA